MECEFCKKEFSTKPNLVYHQKNAKYCLDIQGKQNTQFKCLFCDKIVTCQYRLNDHLNVCKLKDKINYEMELKKIQEEFSLYKKQEKIRLKDKEKQFEQKIIEKNECILKLEEKIAKYESMLVNMAIEPKTTKHTTNNVVINTTLNLTKEHVTKLLDEHMTKDVVAGGQKGLAQMVCEKMLKGPDGKLTYKCVDPSRHNFEFLNAEGVMEKDIKAIKLKNALISGDIMTKANQTGNEIWTREDGTINSDQYTVSADKVMEIICIDKDDSKFRSELSALTF